MLKSYYYAKILTTLTWKKASLTSKENGTQGLILSNFPIVISMQPMYAAISMIMTEIKNKGTEEPPPMEE